MAKTLYESFPPGYRALAAMEAALAESSLPSVTRELVKMRSSQINGCAYCLDMHYKDARAAGETEERLYMLNAWREATVYTDAERAALALTEAVTRISEAHVPSDVEAEARRHFDEEAYAALVFAIVAINSWNRLAITGHSEPGLYKPAEQS
jgi:AhpD family alkylhydroperoxidase